MYIYFSMHFGCFSTSFTILSNIYEFRTLLNKKRACLFTTFSLKRSELNIAKVLRYSLQQLQLLIKNTMVTITKPLSALNIQRYISKNILAVHGTCT